MLNVIGWIFSIVFGVVRWSIGGLYGFFKVFFGELFNGIRFKKTMTLLCSFIATIVVVGLVFLIIGIFS